MQHKFEQRVPTGDAFDDLISFLSGEMGLMEVSYTKQQQKQKQKQQNKNQDSDTMDVFDKKHQLPISFETENYFKSSLTPERDMAKSLLNLPLSVPILTIAYTRYGSARTIKVYPTLQFLYSHHVRPEYITQPIRDAVGKGTDSTEAYARFKATATADARGKSCSLHTSKITLYHLLFVWCVL